MHYWLMKSEPDAYSWAKLAADRRGVWDGVRNHQAANNLRAMKVGDRAFFYHSSTGKEIVGAMTVTRSAFPDPTDDSGKWVAVEVAPLTAARSPASLAAIRADPRLAELLLVRHSRLSVVPVSPAHWRILCEMSGIAA